MKKKYFMLAGLTILIATLISLSVYAEKGHERKCKPVKLPEPVAATVASLYPQAEIEEVEIDEEGVKLYEIEVEKDDQEFELSIAPDGTLVEEEQEVSIEDLPEAIQQAVAGVEVEEATKEVTYWVVTLTKLETPKITYELEVEEGDKEIELEFAEDGTILEKEVCHDDDHDDHDDHDDDDDDDHDDDDDD